MAGEER